MRPSSLIFVLVVASSCAVRAPGRFGIAAAITANVRADVRIAPPPPPPAPPVAMQGAAVAEFFGIPLEDARDVVFVLDCSGSMDDPAPGPLAQLGAPSVSTSSPPPPPGTPPPPPLVPRKIDVAKVELVDALRRLPAGTPMNVVFFNAGLEAYAATIVPLEDSGRDGLIGFVSETAPSGPTALAPAMRLAFLMNAHRVILLSDGLGNVGGNARDVLRDAREAMQGGVRIDTIGLGPGQDAALLQALAVESGGLYQRL
ncbi:MAG: hypothetical protein K8W52_26675 [Deltaproteobacteria bacterium]|nr:hypothetical protein [Deltaproteobacteria bacterium]